MKLYHGSEFIIEHPIYGKGKPHNDYGLGFYCTENIELAKEWGCGENYDGYANIYDFDSTGMNLLDLSSDEYSILNWIAILLDNRTFRITNGVAKDAKEYLLDNFLIDIHGYDCIKGYRADDSYFAFASDFLNNAITVRQLSTAMKPGKLGMQYVLVSREAFERIEFLGVEEAPRNKYYKLKMNRDHEARNAYLVSDRKHDYRNRNELYVLDLMREEIRNDDPRIR